MPDLECELLLGFEVPKWSSSLMYVKLFRPAEGSRYTGTKLGLSQSPSKGVHLSTVIKIPGALLRRT